LIATEKMNIIQNLKQQQKITLQQLVFIFSTDLTALKLYTGESIKHALWSHEVLL